MLFILQMLELYHLVLAMFSIFLLLQSNVEIIGVVSNENFVLVDLDLSTIIASVPMPI